MAHRSFIFWHSLTRWTLCLSMAVTMNVSFVVCGSNAAPSDSGSASSPAPPTTAKHLSSTNPTLRSNIVTSNRPLIVSDHRNLFMPLLD
jgi:hypothetical protein